MSQYEQRKNDRANDKILLETAGVHIYSDEFVARYIRDELAKHPPGLITRLRGASSADNVKLFASAIAALAGLMIIQEGILPFSSYLGDDALLFGAKCLSAVAGFAAVYVPLDRTLCRPSSMWQSYALEDDGTYRGFFRSAFGEQRVPDFVRDLLGRIRQVLPESAFSIKVLGLDPIITCTTPRGSYVVLIYDGNTIIPEREG